ncbi:hypothetical protein Pint_11207 [Pistacia integerrima]|uniref:Uncharacterized protein n=1 Tax=Pistacia integerrima TaxID=434235 RepID=A0ACC0XKK5_9ROSI|nr:hypothetical protein Pint_11207 [Pistacia integerrima]
MGFLKFLLCRLLLGFRNYGKRLPLYLQIWWMFTLNPWMKTSHSRSKF